MSAALFPWAPPSVSRLVIAWLTPVDGPGSCGAKRPQAGVLPYRMVTVVAGTETVDKLMQTAVVAVHTFGEDMDHAEDAAQVTHQRMLLMGPPLAASQSISYVRSDGVTTVSAVPHSVSCKAIPCWLDYEDDLIYRFYARYEVMVRFR